MKKNIHHLQKLKNFIKNITYFKRITASAKLFHACTLPLVIANVLQTLVVILTDMSHIPIIPLCPNNCFSEKTNMS